MSEFPEFQAKIEELAAREEQPTESELADIKQQYFPVYDEITKHIAESAKSLESLYASYKADKVGTDVTKCIREETQTNTSSLQV